MVAVYQSLGSVVLKMGVFGLEVRLLCLFALGRRVWECGSVFVHGVERERRERERERIKEMLEDKGC